MTGDLAVVHENGYIEIKDRIKDIIISGGENISSIEIETVLDSHPMIEKSAVVGEKDKTWGERPIAFVQLKTQSKLNEKKILSFCKSKLAKYKVPNRIIFTKLDVTPTGKKNKKIFTQKKYMSLFNEFYNKGFFKINNLITKKRLSMINNEIISFANLFSKKINKKIFSKQISSNDDFSNFCIKLEKYNPKFFSFCYSCIKIKLNFRSH